MCRSPALSVHALCVVSYVRRARREQIRRIVRPVPASLDLEIVDQPPLHVQRGDLVDAAVRRAVREVVALVARLVASFLEQIVALRCR